MIRKILGLPVHLLKRALGKDEPAAKPAPAKPAAKPRPTPPLEYRTEHGHDHGHSHDHGHDHGHSHGHEAPRHEEPQDHGHSHGHSHGHDHDHGGARSVDVRADDTPNPNARKFTCSVTVVEKGSLSFNTREEAEKNPLAKALFGLGGVKSVFMVKDFVTVTREESADWGALSPRIIETIKARL